ncbi:SBBP repeat-containing protein [Acidobacteria bacterium AH-259-L09]|nr:SBBP repeat-containing protein [Acidobacteria bacterium AH-259-L09]
MEFDFIVAPGSNPESIRLAFEGIEGMSIDDNTRDLVLETVAGNVVQHVPVIYQEGESIRKHIAGSYVLLGTREVGFEVAQYDTSRALVIDPKLSYSSYLGGTGIDFGLAIAVDSDGNTYLTGMTRSVNFPVTGGVLQSSSAGLETAFVVKVEEIGQISGPTIAYSTYLGGSGSERGRGIAVDDSGNVVVTGNTSSVNFPILTNLQPRLAGGSDVYVAKLNSSGSAILYSTYLGGSQNDFSNGIALDASGNVYLAGQTESNNFPVVNAVQSVFGGGASPGDAFVAKLNRDASALIFSTYLGGSSGDGAFDIALDSNGNAHITGVTGSSNFPVTNALQPTFSGLRDAFVVKLDSAGSTLVYSTYLGGSNTEVGSGIDVDSSGSAYITGFTLSTDFPLSNPLQPSYVGNDADAFITKLNPVGSQLVYSTYLGGSRGDWGRGVSVDPSGNAYVTGSTDSTDFPLASAFQKTQGGGSDVFVSKLNSSGTALDYSSYLGGSSSETVEAVVVDKARNVYITGHTGFHFPLSFPLQDSFGGGKYDAFVAKIAAETFSATPTITSLNPSSSIAGGSDFTLTIKGTDFVEGSVVRWNGETRPATFVDTNTLTVSIPAEDIAKSGSATVVVVNPDGGVSNEITFTINFGVYFAQFGDGEGFSSTLILINPSVTDTAEGTVMLFDTTGTPLSVDINGVIQNGSFPFSIPPKGTALFMTDGLGNLTSGSVQVTSNIRVGGTILFGGSFGLAGVAAVQPIARFLVPIESDASRGVSTGIALSNPNASQVDVTLTLLDVDGIPVPGGTTTIQLSPNGQIAKFPEEMYQDSGIDFSQFRGSLEIDSTLPINGMAIRTEPGHFATLPVTEVK